MVYSYSCIHFSHMAYLSSISPLSCWRDGVKFPYIGGTSRFSRALTFSGTAPRHLSELKKRARVRKNYYFDLGCVCMWVFLCFKLILYVLSTENCFFLLQIVVVLVLSVPIPILTNFAFMRVVFSRFPTSVNLGFIYLF